MPNDVLSLSSLGNSVAVLALQLNEHKAEQLLKYVKHSLNGSLKWEVFRDSVLIELIVAFEHKSLLEFLDLLEATRSQSLPQVAKEIVDGLGRLCHFVFNPESGVVGVA
ncbi:hypothetical protein KC338_g225 [Hortaea werneckii]|nr:hypothetical protein KC338_g225 [Hortaea werneckii]